MDDVAVSLFLTSPGTYTLPVAMTSRDFRCRSSKCLMMLVMARFW